jgi:hypothetical protein
VQALLRCLASEARKGMRHEGEFIGRRRGALGGQQGHAAVVGSALRVGSSALKKNEAFHDFPSNIG